MQLLQDLQEALETGALVNTFYGLVVFDEQFTQAPGADISEVDNNAEKKA